MVRILQATGLVLVICYVMGPRPVSAQEWARKMFAETTHDFGTVARGTPTEHRFAFTNLYGEEVHVADVRASCGCTTPQVTKDTLPPGEQGEIVARFNTDRFVGKKGATLTVVFDRPRRAQVQLRVDGYIRDNLAVTPSELNLGAVKAGASRIERVAVTHRGSRDWRIVDARTDSSFLQVTATEKRREANQVVYDLLVEVSDEAPPGYLDSKLTLTTNDGREREIHLIVQGRILAPLSIHPRSLSFGVVAPGEQVTKQLVVRGEHPFRIHVVACDNPAIIVKATQQAKSTHVLPVIFTAGDEPGDVTTTITVQADSEDGATAKLSVSANVSATANLP